MSFQLMATASSVLATALIVGPAGFNQPTSGDSTEQRQTVFPVTPQDVAAENEVMKYYPHTALLGGIQGVANLSCRLGEPVDCQVMSESPPGVGFGAAALKLAGLFHAIPSTAPFTTDGRLQRTFSFCTHPATISPNPFGRPHVVSNPD